MPRDVETLQTDIAASLRSHGTSRSGTRRLGNKVNTNAWRRTRRGRGSGVSSLDIDAADDKRVCFCRVFGVKAKVYEDKVFASALCTT